MTVTTTAAVLLFAALSAESRSFDLPAEAFPVLMEES